ncbi:MAG: hypothetical protein A2Z04_03340 [Chloroflexi bacterium RBG_16_57_9]|nr:MAG: hypothetical protein A2Z04_03340 [Chloroflexi bacterium RBG_16_57_9]
MRQNLNNLTCEIELQPGEKLTLPESIINAVGAGHWIITIQPFDAVAAPTPIRDHSAFLHSYAPEDEGLYDDYPSR